MAVRSSILRISRETTSSGWSSTSSKPNAMAHAVIGRTLKQYEIVEPLGEGGMGVVYKARDRQLDRVVALKILPAAKVADADSKRRFVQEAQAASALSHPNIVTIYGIDEVDGGGLHCHGADRGGATGTADSPAGAAAHDGAPLRRADRRRPRGRACRRHRASRPETDERDGHRRAVWSRCSTSGSPSCRRTRRVS